MSSQPAHTAAASNTPDEIMTATKLSRRDLVVTHGDALARSLGYPGHFLRERFEFANPKFEYRRIFSELLGTFMLVTVAVGGGMVNARFGGDVIPLAAAVTAPALMVGAVILFMGSVSGAHLNPAVTLAFALRHDFPWQRVPMYIVAQMAGAILATLMLIGLLGSQGSAGLTLPGVGISTLTAMFWEVLLTAILVSVILGASSGAQNVGSLSALAVTFTIALDGLFGAPVSGASMNPARSLGPALVMGDFTAWWAYLIGPIAGGAIAVGMAFILRGRGGGYYGRKAADGSLGWLWAPGPLKPAATDPAAAVVPETPNSVTDPGASNPGASNS